MEDPAEYRFETKEPEPAPQWAVVELMGHVRTGGRISVDNMLGTPLLRLDVPTPTGDVTQLVNPASIYRVTFCTEELARQAAKGARHEPISAWELPAPAEETADDEDQGDFFQ